MSGLRLSWYLAGVLWVFITLAAFPSPAAPPGDLAETLSGRVLLAGARTPVRGAEVTLLDRDGAILDVGETDPKGRFSLDLGVMDDPRQAAVVGLYLEVRVAGRRRLRVQVGNVMTSFGTEVKVGPLLLPTR